jgi:DNA-binding MarR family transcriptional regulator
MPDEGAGIPEIDRLIHEPARLTLLTVLSSCEKADFTFLQNITGISKGNLSVQISRLESGALITVKRTIYNKKTRTTVQLTKYGRAQIVRYWQVMDDLRERTKVKNLAPALAYPAHS